ncbi:BN860_00298g1_1 [Zygosaccharomyces bailii CLIB 213]|uniref:BN860_00298g1_1 n=1 Tax=Zygosaccharomyces bailii (strain CLIB 213 / ATCC 58445 / CBS 680 / BCRC 21525 / NBRC 1098 / NCYC 1416 / NRRL Y-2227) TaxID=1333698 RepID=A0A8J2T3P9_ZYGB2|nr:BN860_00298g1_1 [Zygosaccharomyces bailii CLIB 213]
MFTRGASRLIRRSASKYAARKVNHLSFSQSRAYSFGEKFGSKNRGRVVVKGSLVAGGSVIATIFGLSLFDFSDGDIPVKEVMKHNNPKDCWIVLNGKVYEVTSFLGQHPGGASRIMEVAGKDATARFHQVHSEKTLEKMKGHLVYVGKLKGKFENYATEEDLRIEDRKEKIPPLETIFCLSDFESVAKEVLPKTIFTFFATGSSDEFSLRENHYAYSRVFFRPRILQDIEPENIDTSTTFLGSKADLPIYVSGFAGSRLAHPLGEKNLQAAAYKYNMMQMVPKQNSFSPEEFYPDVPPDQIQTQQYHFNERKEIDEVDKLLEEWETHPTLKGYFFNVDLADIGNREKDNKQRAKTVKENAGVDNIVDHRYGQYPKFTWEDVERIVASTNRPVALKGVQRGEDVVIAAKKGVKAVVLSNTGGRQLDFSRPPLEVLVESRQMLKENNLEDKIELYLDGGVRRGSDVVKALCLGATGVGLGIPFLYAMAGYGEEGASHLIEILKEEIKNNMRLLGVEKIEDLNESLVDYRGLNLRSKANDVLYDSAYEPLSFPEFKKDI